MAILSVTPSTLVVQAERETFSVLNTVASRGVQENETIDSEWVFTASSGVVFPVMGVVILVVSSNA